MLNIGIAGYVHLILFGLVLPWAAFHSAAKLSSFPYPPRRRFYLGVLLQHIFFIGATVAVAYFEKIPLLEPPRQPLQAVATVALVFTAAIAFMLPRWRRNVEEREPKIYLFMPDDTAEKSLWVLLSAAAGIGEEITYRGVMWVLWARLTGSLWIAALIASIIFAVSHYMQGWTSISAIFGFALVFHLLVWLSGSLIPAMFLHFFYDLTAGMTYSYLGEKTGYQTLKRRLHATTSDSL
ncbi:MAG: CPBP family intramembrane metalloprotease [Blastocatellia bacterium]|nr:CPBP family intramembrane metalloprotease [Blastocatellia bacterium]